MKEIILVFDAKDIKLPIFDIYFLEFSVFKENNSHGLSNST